MLAHLIVTGVVPTGGDAPPVEHGVEPITLAEAKAHLRILDDESEDDLIAALIVAAREHIEHYTGLTLVRREVAQGFEQFRDRMSLEAWPIADAGSLAITYVDADGVDQSVSEYRLLTATRPARILWNLVSPQAQPGSVTIRVDAGYASRDDVPRSLRQAMLLLVGQWYANREVVASGASSELPFAVAALARAHRLPVVG